MKQGPKRKSRLKARNAARQSQTFVRVFGSVERVAWIQSLPCLIADQHTCGGPIENAHVAGGGTSRKADARFVVPACQLAHTGPGGMHSGIKTFAARYGIDLDAEAAQVDASWRAHRTMRGQDNVE